MPEAKPGPVPELRFPEFREAGPWEVKRLGEIAELKAGKFIPASDIRADSEHGLNPCYGGNGLRGFTESFTHSGEYPLIGRQGAYSGNVQLAEGRFHATEHAIVVTPVESASTKFLFKLLVRANLSRLVTGQAQPGLSVARLNGVSLPLPSLPEQQKIAICLGSLEDLIRAEEGRLEALRAHKTGLMQRLFPAPGQTTPRLRFPEFQNAGPWEVKRLGELFEERTERGGKRDQLLSVTMGSGVVRASDLDRRTNASSDLSNYKQVLPGDIVYNSMRMWQGASGVSIDSGLVSPAYTVVIPGEEQVSGFWGYYFKHPSSLEKFTQYSQGVTSDTWNLKFPAFSTIKMLAPRLVSEQQRIADCLTSLDDLIRAQGETIEALKTHKRGLMNRLFPREVG